VLRQNVQFVLLLCAIRLRGSPRAGDLAARRWISISVYQTSLV